MEQRSLGGIQGAFLFSLPLPLSNPPDQRASNFVSNLIRHFVYRISQNLSLTLFHPSSTLIDEILWHLATCPSSGLSPTKRPPTRYIRVLSCQVRDVFWACTLARISREYARTVHHRYCIQTYAKGREILLRLHILRSTMSTNACCAVTSSMNFALSSQITMKNRSISDGARGDASPPEKQASFSLSRERGAGNFFQADRRFLHDARKNITLLQGRIVSFQKFFFRQFTKTIGFTYP